MDKVYVKVGDKFVSSSKKEVVKTLPPSMYAIGMTESGEIVYTMKQNTHDDLVHLPDTVYDKVVNEIDKFLRPETKKTYVDNGFVYKRSMLLYGNPGTGKTCIVNRVAHDVISKGGIVLFNTPPSIIDKVYDDLDEHVKDSTRLVMCIFEELDQLSQEYEEELLHILDGEIQRENIIYCATTNYLDKVPTRLLRPGRFPLKLEVLPPTDITRKFYLGQKLAETDNIDDWVSKTEGFTIDELKETVLCVKCLDYTLDKAVSQIKNLKLDTKSISLTKPDSEEEYGVNHYRTSDLENEIKSLKKSIKKTIKKNEGNWLSVPLNK